jgi:hypothetical protein
VVTLLRRYPQVTFFVLAYGLSWILESPLALRQATEMEEIR